MNPKVEALKRPPKAIVERAQAAEAKCARLKAELERLCFVEAEAEGRRMEADLLRAQLSEALDHAAMIAQGIAQGLKLAEARAEVARLKAEAHARDEEPKP
jgi:hypothetical protein